MKSFYLLIAVENGLSSDHWQKLPRKFRSYKILQIGHNEYLIVTARGGYTADDDCQACYISQWMAQCNSTKYLLAR